MATYKLIQDIEAEDHILGPLSLRQFIFALVACFFGYLCFFAITKGYLYLLALFLPPAVFFGFFAFPFGKDQPTEVWFLAKLRFWFLPRKRIWDQSGVKELVTITVPKKVERVLTDGLSQNEVKSRLQALANTIDSRGWAVKNVAVYATPSVVVGGDSDRLLDLSSFPQEVPTDDAASTIDMLDTVNNPMAQKMSNLVDQSAQDHHQKLVEELNSTQPPAPPASNNWFMGQGAAALATPVAPVYVPPPEPAFTPPPSQLPAQSDVSEDELARQLRKHTDSQDLAYENMRTMRTTDEQLAAPAAAPPTSTPPMTTPSDPAILALASNDDLNVDTLAREAKKARGDDEQHPDEVVVSLR